jgi:serine/threonine protein kinase
MMPPVELQTTRLMPPDTATSLPPDHPDVSIPDVALETYLGGSGQGWVWAARVMSTGRIVAVKILAGDYVENAGLAAREAMICAKLRHPNIIRVFHVQPAGFHWVVIMELVQGENLRSLEYTTTERKFFGELADAVRTISESQVVHRDLKPANIVLRLLSRSPVVVDFGLAVDLETPEWNREGIAGTPLFMAPEAISGRTPDASWDAYSLGITAAVILLDYDARRRYRLSSNSEIFEAKSSGHFDCNFRETVRVIEDETLRDWCLDLTSPDSWVRWNAVRRGSEWVRVGSDAQPISADD